MNKYDKLTCHHMRLYPILADAAARHADGLGRLVVIAAVVTLHVPRRNVTVAQNCVAFYCATSDHPAEVGFACNGKVRSLEFWNGARIMHKLLLMEPSSFLSCPPASLRCVVTFSLQTFLNKASDERFTTGLSCFVSAGNQKWGQQLYLSE